LTSEGRRPSEVEVRPPLALGGRGAKAGKA